MRQPRQVTRTLVLVIVGVLLAVSLPLVLAQPWVQPDGRLNQVAHFGGDAFYCVDENHNPTNQYLESGQGFRLLNLDGQELWVVSPSEVDSVVSNVTPGQGVVLVAVGTGTYGATALYVEIEPGGRRFFTFTGYDEHGKTNSLRFEDCTPVGAAVFNQSPVPSGTLPPSPTLGGPTETPTQTVTAGPSLTPTNTLTPTDTFTPTNTVTPTDTFTATNTVTPTDTLTATNTATPTDTPTNTATPA